jgi:hypothetical protein
MMRRPSSPATISRTAHKQTLLIEKINKNFTALNHPSRRPINARPSKLNQIERERERKRALYAWACSMRREWKKKSIDNAAAAVRAGAMM